MNLIRLKELAGITPQPVVAYHGTTKRLAHEILSNGFKIHNGAAWFNFADDIVPDYGEEFIILKSTLSCTNIYVHDKDGRLEPDNIEEVNKIRGLGFDSWRGESNVSSFGDDIVVFELNQMTPLKFHHRYAYVDDVVGWKAYSSWE